MKTLSRDGCIQLPEPDDLFIDSPVDDLPHEPGQVRREGIAQLRESWCTPMCGFCSNNSYDHYYGPSASKEHTSMRLGMLAEFYAQADEMMKDGYCWPVW